MCAIAGWVSFQRDLSFTGSIVSAMANTMGCRGPDDAGAWTDRHAALGHRRLAVIDLPGGRQPMAAAEEQVVITFSGEVYNFVELRDQLRGRGHRFRTASDTEVVLRAYLEWGGQVAGHLNGMYAFAIWDARTERLLMVRDRLGVKPLFYHRTSDGVLFGSEPKAILAHPLATAAVDLEGVHRMLAYAVTVPGVVWSGILEVQPGTTVTVSRAATTEHRYWQLPTRPHPDDHGTTIATVRELLRDIVSRQQVADVPHCVLLSGGLDSSALTALAAGRGERVRTSTVDFIGHGDTFVPDAERPGLDAPHVRAVVAHVGTDHREVLVDNAALANSELREKVVRAYDLPPGSGDRDRSLHLLFRAIREHSVVALSGESADELFGGYHWFHDPRVQRAAMFPWITSVFDTYGLPPAAIAPHLREHVDLRAHLGDEYRAAVREVDRLDGADDHEHRLRLASHHHLTRHLRVLLDRKDRLSMAAGLEVRVPFCDHRLVEYVYNVPWRTQTFDGREKSLLRAAVHDLLPASVVDRRKSAYPVVSDPLHVAALQRQAKEIEATPGHRVFDLVDRSWLSDAAQCDPARTPAVVRNGLEWILNLAVWLDVYRPRLRLP